MIDSSYESLEVDLNSIYSDDKTNIMGKINTVSDYIGIISKIDHGKFYRGQGDARWRIVSSLTRAIFPSKKDFFNKKEKNEIDYRKLRICIDSRINDIFNAYVIFKNNLPTYISEIESKEFLINSNLSILLLAQHYGLPTRFIDVSINPLIALYFAVSKSTIKTQDPAAVFVYDSEAYLTGDEFDYATKNLVESIKFSHANTRSEQGSFREIAKLSSFGYRFMSVTPIPTLTDTLSIEHYSFDKRMQSQECLFLFHNNFEKPFQAKNEKNLNKIIINNPYRIKKELMNLGIVESKIYPSLSGFSNTLLNRKINNDFSFFD